MGIPSPILQLGSEIESTQMTADIYEREGAIQIDYSGLAEDLKVNSFYLALGERTWKSSEKLQNKNW